MDNAFAEPLMMMRALCKFISSESDSPDRRITGLTAGISRSVVSLRVCERCPFTDGLLSRTESLFEELKAHGAKLLTVKLFSGGSKRTLFFEAGEPLPKAASEPDTGAPPGWLLRVETGGADATLLDDLDSFVQTAGPIIGPLLENPPKGDVFINGERISFPEQKG